MFRITNLRPKNGKRRAILWGTTTTTTKTTTTTTILIEVEAVELLLVEVVISLFDRVV